MTLLFGQTKALVGGTLIDGFGGQPIRNSVILIESERIIAVGAVGRLTAPDNALVQRVDFVMKKGTS